ncbi:MED16 isoform 7 [Pan troglodytes]|uniref:Mediator complex subunit 16 n=3 Tax=Pan TaxID=9596 RepID=A0A2I3SBH4_PANTR|nr:MED16 isoform 7 [Pan troglodytes]
MCDLRRPAAGGMMDLAYVCEWEKWSKSTHCPSVPLACAWSCRNLIAFTMDLRSDDQGLLCSCGGTACSLSCRFG